MDLEFVLFVIVGFIAVIIQGKAGIQYRISAGSFNKVAKVLTSRPDGYFVQYDEAQANGQFGDVLYRLTNFKIKEAQMNDVSVKITQDNFLEAKATLSGMELTGDVLLEREQINDTIYHRTTDLVFSNVTFVSAGQVEYVGVGGNTVMTMSNCSVEAESVDPGDDFLQATPASLSPSTVNKMFTDAVCSVYKLQFSLGFTKTTLDLDLDLFKLHVSFYPAHLAIEDDTLLLMYSFDLRFSDDIFPVETEPYLIPQFPPVQATASPFEIWLNADVFNDVLDDYLENIKIEHGHKIKLTDILPIVEYDSLTSYFQYLHMIPKTFPNSTIDVYVTDGDLSIELTPQRVLLHINACVELMVTLNCNRSKTYTAVKFLIKAFIPMQVGYNQTALTFKFVLFGGNITVLETQIGKVADRFLSNIFWVLPQFLPSSMFDKLNAKIKGQKISELIPLGTFLHNINVTTVQGYLVIQGDLTDEAPTNTENSTDLSWTPAYTYDYLHNLWFPLIDDTPEDQEPIPVQDCTIVTSSARCLTSQAFYLPTLVFLALVFAGLK